MVCSPSKTMPNGEGYKDPTADIAVGIMTRWEKQKKKKEAMKKNTNSKDRSTSK